MIHSQSSITNLHLYWREIGDIGGNISKILCPEIVLAVIGGNSIVVVFLYIMYYFSRHHLQPSNTLYI